MSIDAATGEGTVCRLRHGPTVEILPAAPYSRPRRAEDQTPRRWCAVNTRGVLLASRESRRRAPGVIADWIAVFDEAARLQVAIEVGGDPSGQDLEFARAGRGVPTRRRVSVVRISAISCHDRR